MMTSENAEQGQAQIRPPMGPAFYVPGTLYGLLAVLTVVYGIGQLWPMVELWRAHGAAGVPLKPMMTFLVLFVTVTSLYTLMAIDLFTRSYRTMVMVGAIASCVLLPFGTVAGVLVLVWTRRVWPKEIVLVQKD